ncbi:MAG: tRNA (N(6)-L-threonylcarbamoyladenosine(37)-C(2))-methylthiotransferase [Candidatus Nitrosothermus koennekii]|nr:MAG: tRNA (N(6)-L-threonylcarbamoyladenosine(37)-C(2))-methylthiotransferase [Candidatus Nitrosothermus koennekii]
MAKIRIEYYGCSANVADAEMIAGILANDGHEIVNDDEDLNVIVTCTVKDATANRMIYRIKRLSNKPLVVAGCFAKAEHKKVERLNPNASLLSPDAIDQASTVVNNTLKGKRLAILEGSSNKVNLPRIRLNPVVSIVEIGSGCLNECTFCETKIAKGWLKSYEPNHIVREISNNVKEGIKEIWLTSTDNGAYGHDLGINLAKLLKYIVSIDGNFKVRVGMMNPMFMPFMLDELIEIFKDDKIFKFIHIPIQSGSDKILKKMKRNHKAELFLDIVNRFRREIKDITIATDVIVGFPGESKDDFNATVSLMKEARPDIINIARYSARPNTEAREMEDKVDVKEMKERSSFMHKIAEEISLANNKRWLGWKGRIIIDEIGKNGVQGRNYAYKPIFIKNESIELGKEVQVKVTKALPNSLIAKIV